MLRARHSQRNGLLLAFLASSALLLPLQARTTSEPQRSSSPDGEVILEVVNNHFTIGQKIPSVYLKLLSDGTAECHTLQFTGRDERIVKRRTLNAVRLAEAKAILNHVASRIATGRYELPRTVVDSWMEWDISIHAPELKRDLTVSFGPPGKDNRPYPSVLAELGCLILKLRGEVYGDNTTHYRPACEKSTHSQR